jgi:hypothetical protein
MSLLREILQGKEAFMMFRGLRKHRQLLKLRILLMTTQQQPQAYLGGRPSGEVVVLYIGGGVT